MDQAFFLGMSSMMIMIMIMTMVMIMIPLYDLNGDDDGGIDDEGNSSGFPLFC